MCQKIGNFNCTQLDMILTVKSSKQVVAGIHITAYYER